MIVSVDLEKILPAAHHHLIFEPMDKITLQYVKKHYEQDFSIGTVIGWTNPDKGPYINIEFESESDAVMFALRWQ